MKQTARLIPLTLLLVVWQATTLGAPSGAQAPVVRAVLFFSPTCPHCHKVINEDLPVIFRRFGGAAQVWFDQNLPRDQVPYYLIGNGQLEILLVDASVPGGNELYLTATEALQIPENRRGVPRLVVRDSVLVGSVEIPTIFPGMIEEGLAGGGIDWPDLAGMGQALAQFPWLQPLAAEEGGGEPAAEAETEAAPGTETAPPAEGEGRTEEAAEAGAEARNAAQPDVVPDSGATGERRATSPDSVAETGLPVDSTSPGDAVGARGEPEAGEAGDTSSTALRTAELAETAASDTRDTSSSPEGAAERPEAAAGEADLGMIAANRPSIGQLYARDPVGNTFSVLVLIGMVASLFAVYAIARQSPERREPGLAIPVLSLLGIVVAGYLAYVESTGAEAVCGPVGDCNTVQQSQYAVLFGVIPVGVVGLAGYVAIVAAWLVARRPSGAASDWAKVALLTMAAFGTLFSLYLTFLEPFVIGASCAWCLTSAVVMTLLMLFSARPAFEVLTRMRQP